MPIGTPVTIGTAFAADANSTIQMTLATNSVSIGDLIIVVAGDDGSQVPPSSVSDSGSNSYVADSAYADSGPDLGNIRVFSAVATAALTAGSSTITVTFSGLTGTWDKYVAALRCTGSWDSSRKDQTTTATGTTAAWASGSVTTTVANELLFGCSARDGAGGAQSSSPTSPWVEIHDVDASNFINYTTVYRVVSSTGSYNAQGTWSGADNWAAAIVTYKEAAGGPSPVPPPHAFMARSIV